MWRNNGAWKILKNDTERGKTYGGEQLVMRRNRVANINFSRVPIACSLFPHTSWYRTFARFMVCTLGPGVLYSRAYSASICSFGLWTVLRTAYESDGVACQRFCALLERCRRSLKHWSTDNRGWHSGVQNFPFELGGESITKRFSFGSHLGQIKKRKKSKRPSCRGRGNFYIQWDLSILPARTGVECRMRRPSLSTCLALVAGTRNGIPQTDKSTGTST